MTHTMKLQKQPFLAIENGEKTIELRLYDEKRKKISVDDRIIFTRLDGEQGELEVIVKAIYKYPTFKDLFSTELFGKCGWGNKTIEQAVESMGEYYTKEQQAKYGVIGIEICKV